MVNPIIDPVLPRELAALGQHIVFKGKVGDLDRLSEIVEAELAAVSRDNRTENWRAGVVDIRLEFGWQDGTRQLPTINGRISAHVPVICQRCLEVYEMSLEAPVNMLLVGPDHPPGEAQEVAEYEIWELEGDLLRPLELIEESLIMAMPLAPTHDSRESCVSQAADPAKSGPDIVRPFAGLRSQMEKSNK